MLLAIDIGNTNLTIGLYDKDKLTFLARLATQKNCYIHIIHSANN